MSDATSFEGQYTFVNDLAQSVPEIKQLMATASAQGWTAQRFADALQASVWWRNNSDTARNSIALSKSDPATYQQRLSQAREHAGQIADSLGIKLTAAQTNAYATATLFQGLDDATLQHQIAGNYKGNAGFGGKSVDLDGQIKQLAAQYGIPVTQKWVDQWVKSGMLTGNDMSGAEAALKQQAISSYPGLKEQIMAGQTVMDAAQPYMASMSQVLEVPETAIKLTDPTIQKALQRPPTDTPGSTQSAAGQAPTTVPLYQFNQELKQDPRWQQTDNAKQTAYSMLHGLGQSFGFAS